MFLLTRSGRGGSFNFVPQNLSSEDATLLTSPLAPGQKINKTVTKEHEKTANTRTTFDIKDKILGCIKNTST